MPRSLDTAQEVLNQMRGAMLKQTRARKALAFAVLGVVTAVAVGTALATPGSGFKLREVVARGTLAPHFKIKLRDSSSPGDVVVQHFIQGPGGQSGWHLHPGPAILTVTSGELTIDQAMDCSSETFSAGQVAVEEARMIHRARNASTTNDLEFWVTFLDVPVGSPPRIEAETTPGWEDPGC
jgi:quercetin dioxygenase-like cupin family protein